MMKDKTLRKVETLSSLFNWISQIHEIVHTVEGHVTLACEVAAQRTCFPECHHTGRTRNSGHFLSHDEKIKRHEACSPRTSKE